MPITAGIDVGSAAIKVVVMDVGDGPPERLASVVSKIRKRVVARVVEETFEAAVAEAGRAEIDYIATTGEGEDVPFATGHFYGMTTHARGALYLEPAARYVLDVGALHARVVAMDERGRVEGYKMTSQCASGSGQFLENIARYLGVSQGDVGRLSRAGTNPEKVSSICAVLAETDVINMVSRGISAPDILRGIHESMAGRFARLLLGVGAKGTIFVSGGLAADEGLLAALVDAIKALKPLDDSRVVAHPSSVFAGAIGAAIWGAYRWEKLGTGGAAWRANPDSSLACSSQTT